MQCRVQSRGGIRINIVSSLSSFQYPLGSLFPWLIFMVWSLSLIGSFFACFRIMIWGFPSSLHIFSVCSSRVVPVASPSLSIGFGSFWAGSTGLAFSTSACCLSGSYSPLETSAVRFWAWSWSFPIDWLNPPYPEGCLWLPGEDLPEKSSLCWLLSEHHWLFPGFLCGCSSCDG